MYDEPMLLVDPAGNASEISDFLVDEPVEEDDGYTYQNLRMSIPIGLNIRPGSQASVVKAGDNSVIVSFIVEGVTMQFGGEQFSIVTGKNIIKFATS